MEASGILVGSLMMMLAVIGTTAIFSRFSPFYRRELAVANRELPLDGLRGLAALMVATHHAALCHNWLKTGVWFDSGSRVIQHFGPAGVLLFFMLTGYLFWGKARASKGWMNPFRLWRGRILRIAPLYLFSLGLILLVALVEQGGNWLTIANWKPMLRLLALGALPWQAIGNFYPGEYNANVIWTLAYEWRFYLILPFIAWLALNRKILGFTVTTYVLIAAGIWFDLAVTPGLYFIFGMLAAELLQDPSCRKPLQRPALAATALFVCVMLCWLCYDSGRTELSRDLLALICFPVFLTAAAGNTFFGFLTNPAMRCLGAISFSLYLLHGILFKFAGYILKMEGWSNLSLTQFWLIHIGVAVLTVCLCAATYRWIEFPFLSISHRNARRKTDSQSQQAP